MILLKRFKYNSPVILSFSLIAVLIYLMTFLDPRFAQRFFMVGANMNPFNPIDYFRLVSHVLGHANWAHLVSNLSFILLLGPILEEKYGSRHIFWMILLTAGLTGIINIMFFSTALLGASGIVFMLIILVSIVDIEQGYIPLTFVLVSIIFLGKELINIFEPDSVSQMAHIIGGVAGAVCGFFLEHKSNY